MGDDILFVQEQLEKVLVGLAETTGETFIAISGVETAIVGANITWTAGWIYYNGELFQVDAGIAPYPANNTFDVAETADPAGNQIYEDLNAENTYVLRKMSIVGNAGGALLFSNLKRLKNFLLDAPAGWSSIAALGTSGNWGAVNGGGRVAGYRTSQTKEVHLNGEVINNNVNVATDAKICTLPNPPAKKLTFICAAIKNTILDFLHVEVDINGDVKPLGLVNTDDVTIFLESIRYPLNWDGII